MQAADDAELPDDPDFRIALRSYIEWAVKEVDGYQSPGSVAPAGLKVPRWGWNEGG
jgi:hemoglobin